jgi:spermidine/putrescine transport system substrate-binding protein
MSFRYVLVCMVLFCASPVRAEQELVIYSWPEYFEGELLREFEREHQVKVREIWYDNDDAKDSEFFLHYREEVDIIVGSGQLFYPYLAAKALAPLPKDTQIPELESAIASSHQELRSHALPFTWGSLGVAYRRDLVAEPIQSWLDILRPRAELQGKINMISDVQDLMQIALLALGLPIDDGSDEALIKAESLLLAQKEYVASYRYMDPTEHADLVEGTLSVAVQYNGDALALKDFEAQIEYVVPEEGGLLWIDYLAINNRAPNLEAAQDFIHFFSRPDVSARNASYLYYASPFKVAKALMDVNVVSNEAVYPPREVLDKLYLPASPTLKVKRFQNSLSMQLNRP